MHGLFDMLTKYKQNIKRLENSLQSCSTIQQLTSNPLRKTSNVSLLSTNCWVLSRKDKTLHPSTGPSAWQLFPHSGCVPRPGCAVAYWLLWCLVLPYLTLGFTAPALCLRWQEERGTDLEKVAGMGCLVRGGERWGGNCGWCIDSSWELSPKPTAALAVAIQQSVPSISYSLSACQSFLNVLCDRVGLLVRSGVVFLIVVWV